MRANGEGPVLLAIGLSKTTLVNGILSSLWYASGEPYSNDHL